MVMPLPSGVIIAPKITKRIIAYLKFFLQKRALSTPVSAIAYIIMGSSKVIPNYKKNCNTKEIKLSIFRNVSTPMACP